MGELLDVWDANWRACLGPNSQRIADLQHTALMRVLALAFDAWVVKVAGIGPRGVAVGDRYADAEKLRAMSLEVALTAASARAYQVAACADREVLFCMVPGSGVPEYTSINSKLKQARCLFTKLAVQFVYEGRLKLPDSVWAWKDAVLLPEVPPEPEPIKGELFANLVSSGEALRDTDKRLWLCARVFRQTGLRCGSVVNLRGDWVERLDDGWQLVAKKVKGGTAKYAVPLLPETALAIREMGEGFVFGDDVKDRERLVYEAHNALIKSVVGMPVRGAQGAHRLRDTLAGALHRIMGRDKAKEALGHEDVEVTLKHYSRVPMEATAVMRAEFGAFLK